MTSLSEKLLANKRFAFTSNAFAEDTFEVVTMQGYESISRPFRFELTLVSDDADIDFEQMLQSQVAFTIYAPDGKQPTPYYGMVAEFDQLHESGGYIFYRVVMVPRIWQLSFYQISEVYLEEKPIPALIKQVLESANFNSNDFEIKTNGQYRDRSFVCQYQESHLDFISRWLEKEGMYYWFDHGQKNDKLIIADDKVMHAPDAVQVNYRPVDELDTGVAPDSVQSFSCRQKPLPKQVILQDFNHRKASTELKATATVSEKGIGEVMFYGENFRTNEEGERYANLRAQEILARSKIFMGESTAVGLRCGFFMQLNHHFRDAFNSQYLITEIEHRGSQAGALLNGIRTPYNADEDGAVTSYSNSFQAIATDTQFRPERTTPKPKVAGTMNAVIDAEGAAEYAELDEFGQYKVQLPFDRTDKKENKGSARIRMASPYAGNGHGMHFPLHKKSEVVLSFTDGDPDQPVILSAVSNSENENIISRDIAEINCIKTAGGNQIIMDDTKESQALRIYSPQANSFFSLGALGTGNSNDQSFNGIWQSTAGSSVSMVMGTKTELLAGVNNSVSLGVSRSVEAGVKNNFYLSGSSEVGYASNFGWKFGRDIVINNVKDTNFNVAHETLADQSIVMSAGAFLSKEKLINDLKKRIQWTVGLSAAVDAAIAGGMAAWIADSSDAEGQIHRKKNKSWIPTAISGGAGVVAQGMRELILRNAAKSISENLSAEKDYVSNIKLNKDVIQLSVVGGLSDSGDYGRLNIYNNGLKFCTDSDNAWIDIFAKDSCILLRDYCVALAVGESNLAIAQNGFSVSDGKSSISIGSNFKVKSPKILNGDYVKNDKGEIVNEEKTVDGISLVNDSNKLMVTSQGIFASSDSIRLG